MLTAPASGEDWPPDVAAAVDRAARRLGDRALPVRWYPTVSSTMDIAAAAVASGCGDGVVVIADEQTAGRGRRGRRWSSPHGAGLYVSFGLRRAPAVDGGSPAPLVTLAAGVAVCSAVHDACGLDAELEWPNDLVAGGRKIAGILAEAVSTDSSVHAVVLGVGVNVSPATHAPDVQARAVSLSQAVGETVDRGAVLEALLVAVPAMCRRLWQGDADAILREWRQRAPSAVGAEVSWDTPAGERHGVTSGVDDTGALLVKTSKGVERIVAGEIRWS